MADATGRRSGRGAYLDPSEACLDKGLAAGALARALETAVTDEQRDRLRADVRHLAAERRTVVPGAKS